MRELFSSILIGAIWIAPMVMADESSEGAKSHEGEPVSVGGKEQAQASLSIYIPPSRGAPGVRTGGGTRSVNRLPQVVALVPDHVAYTRLAQPSLAWHVSGAAQARVELTVMGDASVEPLLETVIASEQVEGINAVSLANWELELEEGAVYQWFVALVPDAEQRDQDVIAGGAIQRVPAPATLASDLAASDSAFRVLGRHGLWYDALEAISQDISAGREDLRTQRAALLAEVGIHVPTKSD